MNDLFINYDKHPLFAELTASYAAAQEAIRKVEDAQASLKHQRGQLLDDKHPERARLERRRAYEVAFLRLKLANGELFAAARNLWKISEKIDAERHTTFKDWYCEKRALLQNNLMCAREVADRAAALYYLVRRQAHELDRFADHYASIENMFRFPVPADEPREYVVMSSGHGSKYRFDEGDGTEVPEGPYMTLSEAKEAAGWWVSYADTIGGGAQIYNVRTRAISHEF
jgi:hypothetical protein